MKKMINHNLIFALIITVANCLNIWSQEIITADGQSMGPKSVFMEVCSENMDPNLLDLGVPYDINDFCNCMADELLPTFTKTQISHYFSQGNMAEMFKDSAANQIITNCVRVNLKTKQPPIMEEISSGDNEVLIDSIILICNYKAEFNSIKKRRMTFFVEQNNWDEKTVKMIESTINFSDFEKWKYYSGYSSYSQIELKEIIEFFNSKSAQELEDFDLKYERVILLNYEHKIDFLIKKAGGLL